MRMVEISSRGVFGRMNFIVKVVQRRDGPLTRGRRAIRELEEQSAEGVHEKLEASLPVPRLGTTHANAKPPGSVSKSTSATTHAEHLPL